MAVSCITSTWGNSYAPQLKLTVDTSSKTDTSVKFYWKLQYIASRAASTSSNRAYTAKINGTTVASGTYNINGVTGTKTIKDGYITINRTKSTQTIKYSCSMDFDLTWGGTYAGTKSASDTFTISAITSYTVAYNANGGSGTPSSQTKWHGTALTLSSTKPTRTGYSFNKWNTASGGTGTSYASGASYTSNASATLYAQWTANTYKVTYNANGGSLGSVPSSQTKTYGVNLTLSTATPTRTNYTFKGWGTSSSATTVSYAKGATYTSNASITLYAIWELSYTKPTISNFNVARYDKTNDVKSDEGTSALVSFNWSSYKDVTSVKIHWKESTATSYSDANSYTCTTSEVSGKSGSVSKVIGNAAFSTENSYDIKVTVTDSDSSYSVKNIPSIILPIDFLAGGKGVAIGKTAKTSNLLDVEWAIKEQGTLLSKKYSKHVDLYGSNVQNDYCYTVIGVCNTGGANASPDSYTIGQFTFHRTNGLTGAAIVDVAIEAQYAGANAINAKVNQYGYSTMSVEPCTFTYNGVVYGGLKVFFNAAALKHVEFNGSSNFNIFALDYYNTQSGVINSEVYNSIKVASNSGHNFLSGSTYIKYANYVYGVDIDGVNHNILGIDSTNNILYGYGSYANAKGKSSLYGNSIVLGTRSNLSITNVTNGTVATFADSGNLTIGYSYGASSAVAMYWRDGSVHHILSCDTDGLSAYLGWAGNSSYATVTTIRGRTCKYANSSGTTTLSDRNLKKDFEEFTDVHDVFFDNLKPLTYRYKMGSSGRPHFGFITQEVEEALETAGMTTKDFAGVNIMPINCRETEEDENGNKIDVEDSADNYLLDKGIKEQHNLVYTEFISMNTWQIQKLKKRVKEQDEKINKLEEEMQRLKELVEQLVSA